MFKGFGFSALAVLISIVGLLGLWSSRADAQSSEGSRQSVTIKLTDIDVREGLRYLFKTVSHPYSIAPEVQGRVTVDFKDVPFELALQSIVKQVDATYRLEGGIYQIVRRESRIIAGRHDPRDLSIIVPSSAMSAGQDTAPVITQDGKFLYILRGMILYKVSKSDLKTVTQRRLGE